MPMLNMENPIYICWTEFFLLLHGLLTEGYQDGR